MAAVVYPLELADGDTVDVGVGLGAELGEDKAQAIAVCACAVFAVQAYTRAPSCSVNPGVSSLIAACR